MMTKEKPAHSTHKRARSPFALPFPRLQRLEGVEVWSGASGLREDERPDLMVMRFAENSVCAGVFTRSSAPAVPVIWSRARLREGKGLGLRALLVNSGQANAMTGQRGVDEMHIACEALAEQFALETRQILVASTGIIGQPPSGRLIALSLPRILACASPSPSPWHQAAQAIMTTDTFPKGACEKAEIEGVAVTLIGIAKGAGMIAPDMATMLAFIATDAKIESSVLQSLLAEGCRSTFNAVSIDGDMSTNDTVFAIASGAAGNRAPAAAGLVDFKRALSKVLRSLARQIAMDGEGISKFVSVRVSGALSSDQARVLGLSVVSSPLVKTAIAGGDANWGRIAMALGKTRLPLDWERLSIALGGHVLYDRGTPQEQDTAEQADLAAKLRAPRIAIHIDLRQGQEECETWGCDLTHDYLRINIADRS